MNDKRSESTHPSARPPLPSIAPPTEDIDAEWGADEAPAPAKVLQPAAPQPAAPATASAPPAAGSTPLPTASPSYPPAPEPPPARTSDAPAPGALASATPVASNPLRKQTLLGIAPVIPPRSSPPAADKPSEPPRPSASSSLPPRASQPAGTLTAPQNSFRKQTLLGIAPVIPQPPEAAAEPPPSAPVEALAPTPTPSPAEPPVIEQSEAEASSATLEAEAAQAAGVDAVASEAPITRDVKSSRPPAPPQSEPAPPTARAAPRELAASISLGDHELPELRPRRSRWLYLLAAAAVIGGGVFALRQMDRAPEPLDESLARPLRPAADPPAAVAAPPAEDEAETGTARSPSEAAGSEPLEAQPPSDTGAATPSATATPSAAAAAAAPSADGAPAIAGEAIRVDIKSAPPGARLFWRGKEMGTTPFTLEIPAGERRSYELGKPGFVTRKVVIDGSKSDISIGLKPEP